MTNETKDSNKVLLGLLIGGVVGAGILYTLHATRNKKTPIMKKIGQTISEVGEMIEDTDLSYGHDLVQRVEKKIPSSKDVVNNVVDWLDTGLAIWKTLNRR